MIVWHEVTLQRAKTAFSDTDFPSTSLIMANSNFPGFKRNTSEALYVSTLRAKFVKCGRRNSKTAAYPVFLTFVVEVWLLLIKYTSPVCLNKQAIRPASSGRLKSCEWGGKEPEAKPVSSPARAVRAPLPVRDKATHLRQTCGPSLLGRFSTARIVPEVE